MSHDAAIQDAHTRFDDASLRPEGQAGRQDMIRVTLSGSWTASAAGITIDHEARRRGSPICTLARMLVDAGHDPATELHVYRGEILCFNPAPLGKWAGLRVKEGGHESARFAPHREPPSDNADSGGREGQIIGHLAPSGGRVPERAFAAAEPAPTVLRPAPPPRLRDPVSPPMPGAAPPAQNVARGSDDEAA